MLLSSDEFHVDLLGFDVACGFLVWAECHLLKFQNIVVRSVTVDESLGEVHSDQETKLVNFTLSLLCLFSKHPCLLALSYESDLESIPAPKMLTYEKKRSTVPSLI